MTVPAAATRGVVDFARRGALRLRARRAGAEPYHLTPPTDHAGPRSDWPPRRELQRPTKLELLAYK